MNQAVSPEAAEAPEADEAESPLARTAGNPSVPNPARVYDALLGGKDNYATDRAVADKLVEGMQIACAVIDSPILDVGF